MAKIILSNRDKTLIYVGSMFAAAALTYMLVISPLTEENTKLSVMNSDNTTFKENMYSEAELADTYEGWYNEASDNLADAKKGFSDIIFAEDADELLTKTLIKGGLTPNELYVSSEEDGDPLYPYNISALRDDFDSEECVYSEKILSRKVSVAFSGTLGRSFEFLDFIKNMDGVIIKNIAIDPGASEFTNEEENVYMTIEFSMFIYKESYESAPDTEENEEDTGLVAVRNAVIDSVMEKIDE